MTRGIRSSGVGRFGTRTGGAVFGVAFFAGLEVLLDGPLALRMRFLQFVPGVQQIVRAV
jgi:hypothetical protein